jgi:cysteinyl-tRNA synthetase
MKAPTRRITLASASDIDPTQIDLQLRSLVLDLHPTANVITSASSVYSRLLGQDFAKPQFLDPWISHGPTFISSETMKLINERIGIDELNKKIENRLQARARKDWVQSDSIRDELNKIGLEVEDHKDGTATWKVKKVA